MTKMTASTADFSGWVHPLVGTRLLDCSGLSADMKERGLCVIVVIGDVTVMMDDCT